jgi:hypothetical protein
MSTEIPDDTLRQYADACFASCYPPVDAVVQAILAERERCAQLARQWEPPLPPYAPWQMTRDLVDAIEEGRKP